MTQQIERFNTLIFNRFLDAGAIAPNTFAYKNLSFFEWNAIPARNTIGKLGFLRQVRVKAMNSVAFRKLYFEACWTTSLTSRPLVRHFAFRKQSHFAENNILFFHEGFDEYGNRASSRYKASTNSIRRFPRCKTQPHGGEILLTKYIVKCVQKRDTMYTFSIFRPGKLYSYLLFDYQYHIVTSLFCQTARVVF